MIYPSHKKHTFLISRLKTVKLPFDIEKRNLLYRLQIVFAGSVVLSSYRCFQIGKNYNDILIKSEGNNLQNSIAALKIEFDKLLSEEKITNTVDGN